MTHFSGPPWLKCYSGLQRHDHFVDDLRTHIPDDVERLSVAIGPLELKPDNDLHPAECLDLTAGDTDRAALAGQDGVRMSRVDAVSIGDGERTVSAEQHALTEHASACARRVGDGEQHLSGLLRLNGTQLNKATITGRRHT